MVKVGRRSPGRSLVLEQRRTLRIIAITLAVMMPVGLLSAPSAFAEPDSQRPKVSSNERIVDGRDLKARGRETDSAEKGPAAKADWPAPGTEEVNVPSANGRSAVTKAGKLPVQILPPQSKPQSHVRDVAGKVRVQVLDRAATARAGANGLAFTVGRTDAGQAGRVGVRVDYSRFAQAFGGAYGSRLRLLQLPQCSLSTPDKTECRTATPIESRNDAVAKTLTADIEAAPTRTQTATAPATGTVLVVAAEASGSQGDYKATSLSSSATWKAGGNSGDFTWSYPMDVPPVPGGLAPEVALSYSSGGVDGKTGNTNGQPSWVGQGFDMWPGFIERRYKSCEDDGAPKDEWGNSPGDLCWGYDNATVTWNGKGGELIKAADGTWRLKNDDGTKFEKITGGTNRTNDDDDGEYWKVTDTKGVQYFFGRNQLPGWSSDKPETGSTWTVPVFGDDDGEPCHRSSFASSWCHQAYRWNLDYVVDPKGNAITYAYGTETNHYGRNLEPEDETSYIRGGYLKSISYGLRSDALYGTAPARVVFDVSERCMPDSTFDCAPDKIGDNPQRWWDVPWDLNCNSGQECKEDHGAAAPTFWSRKRLTKVTTQVIKPDASGHRNVDSWALDHDWGLADVERDLRLKEIQHTGHAADTPVTLPKVTFNYEQMPNRLDKTGDDILPYIRYRLGAIYDESGGQIDIKYSQPACTLDDLPTPETNTQRCFPVIWQPPGRDDPITDWFHKYVVTSVTEVDRTGLAPNMATKYEYLGGAAWHFDDDDGLTKEKHKTWSQWRGYSQVRTLTGDFLTPSTQADTYYLRGMDGDRLNRDGGTKQVSVPDGEGGTHTDHEALAGFTLKTVQYAGPGGAVHAKTLNTPWRVQTASRSRSWGTVTANVVNTDTARIWTAKDGGGWTETKTDTDYTSAGTGVGRVQSVNDLGDVTTGTDDKCTRTTYADNTGAHMVAFPRQVETVAVACTATADRSTQVVSDERTIYDGGAFGDAPTKGDVTKTQSLASHDGTTPQYVTKVQTTYDSYGRPTQVTDALGQISSTTYTDTHGLNTKVTTTSPPPSPGATGLTTIKELDPAWGHPVATIDANNLKIENVYDGLGRLRQVWLPNLTRGSNPHPNYEFDYRIAENQIVAVTTKTLTATGGQRIEKIELLDGWLRNRQTQAPGPEGRLVTDTFYDERGQVTKTYAPYSATGAPEVSLFGVGTPGDIESQTHTQYDGLGRKTLERLIVGNGGQETQEKWRTTYSYGGADRTTIDPPAGGIPTTQITNAHDQVIERRQHKDGTTTGPYDATTYTYTPAGETASITDPSGNTWTTSYDVRGRKTTTTDPDRGTTTYTYDDLDRQTSFTDARGQKIFTNYDGLGRSVDTRKDSTDGPKLTSFTYDTAPFGKGKQATATRHHNGADYTTRVRHYDKLGRADVTDITIPATEGGLAGTYLSTITYSLDGTVRGQNGPAIGGLPGESLLYDYDAWLRPTRLTSAQTTYVNDTVYTPTGKLQLLELGNTAGKRVWQTFGYEYGTQRLKTARTLREGLTGADRDATYDYDDAGSIKAISDASRDGTDTQCFAYDGLQRLTQAWTQPTTACADEPASGVIGGPAPYWHTYGYDTAGNRKTETRHGVNGQPDTERTYTYTAAGNGNRLQQVNQTGGEGHRTDSYGYDATGNTTQRTIGNTIQSLDWGPSGELTTVTEGDATTTYIYGPHGDRLLRKDPGGTTLYLANTELRLNNGSTSPTGTRYYIFADQTVAMRTPDGVTHLADDHQGTAQIAVNATDQTITTRRHTTYGAVRGLDDKSTWPNDKGFVGGTNDPTGLTHLGARQYDPDTGRFISVDPLMDPADPQQMNGYTYANNNPVTNSDPDGLMACPSSDWCENVTPPIGAKPGSRKGWVERNHPGLLERGRLRAGFPIVKQWDNVVGVSRIPIPKVVYPERFRTVFWKFAMNSAAYGAHAAPEDVYAEELQAAVNACREIKECVGNKKAYGTLLAAFAELNLGAFVGSGRQRRASVRGMVGASKKRLGMCNSFVSGSKVLMADGGHKPIEDVDVGDKVVATDTATGETTTKRVVDTITGKGTKNLVQITVDESHQPYWTTSNTSSGKPTFSKIGNRSDSTGVVIATDEHPFWVAGDLNKWVKAEDLKPGMWLRTSSGTFVQVTVTKHWTKTHQRVHNLTIADHHTYYALAGATPVLVHNANCDPWNSVGKYDGDGYPVDGTRIPTNDALDAAEKWLGPGYKEPVPGSGRYVSRDGTRVARMGESDITGQHGGGPHMNFERLAPNPKKPGKMMVVENRHVYLE
ncbi:RHS repeat-associated core domain-containing protein [Spirillospora sp. CA-255316]